MQKTKVEKRIFKIPHAVNDTVKEEKKIKPEKIEKESKKESKNMNIEVEISSIAESMTEEFNELKKNEKVISIAEVKRILDAIINQTEELCELISTQMSMIESESCGCGDEDCDESELYNFYGDVEINILEERIYKAARMVS